MQQERIAQLKKLNSSDFKNTLKNKIKRYERAIKEQDFDLYNKEELKKLIEYNKQDLYILEKL